LPIAELGAGDDPPRDRTSELRVLGFPTRHLGPVQMTTDTALGVTKIVVQDNGRGRRQRRSRLPLMPSAVPLSQIPFADHPTIVFNPQESVEMPFRECRRLVISRVLMVVS
jgi:ribosome biogenesis SPOUT family RNA methylase Rps3